MLNLDRTPTYTCEKSAVFYKTLQTWGAFSNMASGLPILVNGFHIKSSEALYQAMRFSGNPNAQADVINTASPYAAKIVSRKYIDETRPDWEGVKIPIMFWCLKVKLACNWNVFASLLMATGPKPIVEMSYKDQFWGASPQENGSLKGKNVLGRLLGLLREDLKDNSLMPFDVIQPLDIPDFLILGTPVKFVKVDQDARPVKDLKTNPVLSETCPPELGEIQPSLF